MTGPPVADGFRLPGEFAPHAGTWMLWPCRADTWRADAEPAEQAFATVASAIAEAEPVTVGVRPDRLDRARAVLPAGVRTVAMESDDAWMRDVGPTVLVGPGGERRAVDWTFNAWGGAVHGLYPDWAADDRVAAAVADAEGMAGYRCPLVQEGGGLHSDGAGTLFVTAECVLSPGRNAGLGHLLAERQLCDYTGAARVIWLPQGLAGDETTGHVDNLLHVPAPGIVLLTWTDDPDDPQFPRSRAALRALGAARGADDRRFEVRKLPMPGPLHMTEAEAAGLMPSAGGKPRRAGDRLAGSYANFYLANGRAIVPLLDPRTDEAALRIIADALPGYELVGVPAREILLGGGNIHCITQQIPAG
ncbi:agmatine deiminase [Thalassobaculum sp.]|uniref:agmatine deiminase n=1 Tax=Thalassobaculum sp. TaxID=2022740 RepID=UPI0032EECC3D